MILKVCSYYNKLINAFDTEFKLDDHSEKEIVYAVNRSLTAQLILGKYDHLRYLALYQLGTFDDEEGVFVTDKKLLLDFDNVIAQFEAKKLSEASENVGKDNQESAV